MDLSFDIKHDNTEEHFEKRIAQYPGAVVIYWKHNDSTYVHFFYPNLDLAIFSETWRHRYLNFHLSNNYYSMKDTI